MCLSLEGLKATPECSQQRREWPGLTKQCASIAGLRCAPGISSFRCVSGCTHRIFKPLACPAQQQQLLLSAEEIQRTLAYPSFQGHLRSHSLRSRTLCQMRPHCLLLASMQDVLGPSPAFFTSLLTSVWTGLEATHDSAGKQAAATCFQASCGHLAKVLHPASRVFLLVENEGLC
jgi:hypothetical protein